MFYIALPIRTECAPCLGRPFIDAPSASWCRDTQRSKGRLGPVFGRGWAKHRFEEHVRHIPNRRGWTKPDTIPPSHQTNHLGSSRVNEVCCPAPKPVLPCAFASALSMGINMHGVRINQHCQN